MFFTFMIPLTNNLDDEGKPMALPTAATKVEKFEPTRKLEDYEREPYSDYVKNPATN